MVSTITAIFFADRSSLWETAVAIFIIVAIFPKFEWFILELCKAHIPVAIGLSFCLFSYLLTILKLIVLLGLLDLAEDAVLLLADGLPKMISLFRFDIEPEFGQLKIYRVHVILIWHVKEVFHVVREFP